MLNAQHPVLYGWFVITLIASMLHCLTIRTGTDTTVRRLMEIETSLGKKMNDLGETAALSDQDAMPVYGFRRCLYCWMQCRAERQA